MFNFSPDQVKEIMCLYYSRLNIINLSFERNKDSFDENQVKLFNDTIVRIKLESVYLGDFVLAKKYDIGLVLSNNDMVLFDKAMERIEASVALYFDKTTNADN